MITILLVYAFGIVPWFVFDMWFCNKELDAMGGEGIGQVIPFAVFIAAFLWPLQLLYLPFRIMRYRRGDY